MADGTAAPAAAGGGRWSVTALGLTQIVILASVAAVAVSAAVWRPEELHVAATAGVLSMAAVFALFGRTRPLAAVWGNLGWALGTVLIVLLVAATGGVSSPYHHLFAIVPLVAALTYRLPVVLLSGVAGIAGMLAVLVYDAPTPRFAATAVMAVLLWSGVTAIVHLQTVRLRRRSEEARRAEEIKTSMLRATSHELRTPLTSITGMCATLERGYDELDDDTRRMMISKVNDNAVRLRTLLSDLLDLDRLGLGLVDPERRPVALDELVRDIVGYYEGPERHRIELDLDPGVVVEADRPKLERAVENVLRNALRHGPDDTPVTITVRHDDDGAARVEIDDRGPGVPEELRDMVFEPFVQGREKRRDASPGAGIGLSLVRGFVQLHGGRTWVEDSPGGGARFVLQLPE